MKMNAKPRSNAYKGKGYERGGSFKMRILVVGESHHFRRQAHLQKGTTKEVIREWMKRDWEHRYFERIAYLLCGEGDEPRELWKEISFYNFLQTPMPRPGVKPTPKMWEQGLRPFVRVVRRLSPEFILVTGKRLWEHLPDRKFNEFWLRDLVLRGDDNAACYYRTRKGEALALRIAHPSSRRWRLENWKPLVQEGLERVRRGRLIRSQD
jgi:hypothetical protein